MKKLNAIITFIIISTLSLAQAPQKLSYQTVIRNATNALVANQSVSIRISILQGSAAGVSVFSETHGVVTNANGLASVSIGTGTPISGTFATIDWNAGPYFVKSETDPAGGTNYTIVGTSELQSVPYALNALNTSWTTAGADIVNSNTGNVAIGTPPAAPIRKLHLVHDQFTGGGGAGGLEVEQVFNATRWTIYTSQSTSFLKLYYMDTEMGGFDNVSGAYTAISDERLKTNITPLNGMLGKIMQIKPYTYEFKSNKIAGEKYYGFLAQELQTVIPEIVTVNKDDTGQNKPDLMTVSHTELIPILVKGMQEQQVLIESLQKQITELKAKK